MKRYRQARKHRVLRLMLLGISVLMLTASIIFFRTQTTEAPRPADQKSQTQKDDSDETETAKPIDLQPVISEWVKSQPGNYGIVVYDPDAKQTIGSHQPDERYFTASIYKLYVAYVSLIDFQTGAQNPDEVILAGQTRKDCVYKMIHSSDSPCGETILNNIGGNRLTERLTSEFGFTGTNFPGFYTTAADTNRILIRLQAKKDLNQAHTDLLLRAMRTQIYRTGLTAGMQEATVMNKVGFDSPDLWMDTGIITMPNKRQFIVTIYGNGGVGSDQIADFGRTIYAKLAEDR